MDIVAKIVLRIAVDIVPKQNARSLRCYHLRSIFLRLRLVNHLVSRRLAASSFL